jgi:hypothetical protein
MNTLTTDKVYYSPEGKFFVSEREWPYYLDRTHHLDYLADVTKCISEGYEIVHATEIALEIYTEEQNAMVSGTLYTIPEPREFEVRTTTECEMAHRSMCYAGCKCPVKSVAVLLPKKEEQKYSFIQKRKGSITRANWLKICLEIGYPKSVLDQLEKIWDEHKDEAGNLKPIAPVSNDKQSEEQKEIDRLKGNQSIQNIAILNHLADKTELNDTIELQRKEIDDWKDKHDLAYKCAEMRGLEIDGLVEGLKEIIRFKPSLLTCIDKDFQYPDNAIKALEAGEALIHKHTPSESKQS